LNSSRTDCFGAKTDNTLKRLCDWNAVERSNLIVLELN